MRKISKQTKKMISNNQQSEDRYEQIKAQWRAANHRYYEKVKDDEEFKRRRSEYHKQRYRRLKAARLEAAAREQAEARARAACA